MPLFGLISKEFEVMITSYWLKIWENFVTPPQNPEIFSPSRPKIRFNPDDSNYMISTRTKLFQSQLEVNKHFPDVEKHVKHHCITLRALFWQTFWKFCSDFWYLSRCLPKVAEMLLLNEIWMRSQNILQKSILSVLQWCFTHCSTS